MTPPTPAGGRPRTRDRPVLRAEVAALRRREQRRIFPARLCVGAGSDGGWPRSCLAAARRASTTGCSFDLLDGLLRRRARDRRATGSSAWLVRPGVPELHDLDLRVAAVADRRRRRTRPATPAAGGLVVLTRYGWLDPRTRRVAHAGSGCGSRTGEPGRALDGSPRCAPGALSCIRAR